MAEILITILKISAVAAIPVSSLIIALKMKRIDLKEIRENRSILLKYVLCMFIISPLVAVALNYFFSEYRPVWIALLLIALSPPSAGVVEKVGKIGISKNIGLITLLAGIVLSLIFIPLTLLLLERVFNINLDLGIDDVLKKIAIIFIIPLIAGFLISYFFGKYNDVMIKILEPIAKIAMLVLVICLLILAVPIIIKGGLIPVLLVLLFQVILLVIVHFISGSEKVTGPVLPYSVLMRLPAPAIVIAQINNSVERHLSTILAFVILGALLLAVYGKITQGGKEVPKN